MKSFRDSLNTFGREGAIDLSQLAQGKFPFDAWNLTPDPDNGGGTLSMKDGWKLGSLQVTFHTEAEWVSLNPILKTGEIGFVTDQNYFYIGDGVTAWNDFSEGGRYYNKAGDFEYIISRTKAEWTALNPTLEENQIGIVSDAGYFKTGDGTTAWNSLTGGRTIAGDLTVDGTIIGGEPVSLGDFNISATNHTTNLDELNANYDVGTKFVVSGYGGDGSHSHRFTGTGHTLDGINPTAADNWKGQGVFYIPFFKKANKTWQTYDVDVWDSDGGKFAAGKWEKRISGKLEQYGKDSSAFPMGSGASLAKTIALPIPFADTNYFRDLVGRPISSADFYGVTYKEDASPFFTKSVFSCVYRNGITAQNVVDHIWIATGRWTTSYPRRR